MIGRDILTDQLITDLKKKTFNPESSNDLETHNEWYHKRKKKGGGMKLRMLSRHEIMPINFLQEVLQETYHFKFQACNLYSNLTHVFYCLLIIN